MQRLGEGCREAKTRPAQKKGTRRVVDSRNPAWDAMQIPTAARQNAMDTCLVRPCLAIVCTRDAAKRVPEDAANIIKGVALHLAGQSGQHVHHHAIWLLREEEPQDVNLVPVCHQYTKE